MIILVFTNFHSLEVCGKRGRVWGEGGFGGGVVVFVKWLFHPKAPIWIADVMPGKSVSEPRSETSVFFGAS